MLAPILGVTDRLELSLEIPYMFHNPAGGGAQNGLGDINAVGKYLLYDEGPRLPAFALKGVVKTATGNKSAGLGSGDIDYSFIAVASKCLDRFVLHSMFGYTIMGKDGNSGIRNIFQYGIAADFKAAENLNLVFELAGYQHPDRSVTDNPLYCLLGAILKISDKVTADAGVRLGLTESAAVRDITMGISATL